MNKKEEVFLFAIQEGMTSIKELEEYGYDPDRIFAKDKTALMRLRTILNANKIREEKNKGRDEGRDR